MGIWVEVVDKHSRVGRRGKEEEEEEIKERKEEEEKEKEGMARKRMQRAGM